ncbi:MAG: IPT/TIG domain-containing protein [Acidobacteriota bacterium]
MLRTGAVARQGIGRGVVFLAAVGMTAVASLAGAAEKNCWKAICREGFHFDGQRCVDTGAANPIGADRHDPPRPLCRPGWHLQGQYCLEEGCCSMPACGSGETYRDRQCLGASAKVGAGAARRAACGVGWELQPASGLCRKRDCGVLPPEVRGHSALPCVDLGGTVTLYGENFGADRGARTLAIWVGYGIAAQVTAWDETAISFVVPARESRIEAGQEYPVMLMEGPRVLLGHPLTRIRICGAME